MLIEINVLFCLMLVVVLCKLAQVAGILFLGITAAYHHRALWWYAAVKTHFNGVALCRNPFKWGGTRSD